MGVRPQLPGKQYFFPPGSSSGSSVNDVTITVEVEGMEVGRDITKNGGKYRIENVLHNGNLTLKTILKPEHKRKGMIENDPDDLVSVTKRTIPIDFTF